MLSGPISIIKKYSFESTAFKIRCYTFQQCLTCTKTSHVHSSSTLSNGWTLTLACLRDFDSTVQNSPGLRAKTRFSSNAINPQTLLMLRFAPNLEQSQLVLNGFRKKFSPATGALSHGGRSLSLDYTSRLLWPWPSWWVEDVISRLTTNRILICPITWSLARSPTAAFRSAILLVHIEQTAHDDET